MGGVSTKCCHCTDSTEARCPLGVTNSVYAATGESTTFGNIITKHPTECAVLHPRSPTLGSHGGTGRS